MKKVIVILAAILFSQIALAETPEFIIFDANTKPQIEVKDSNITIGDVLTVYRTTPNKESGVVFKPKEGTWDLSKYSEVNVMLLNQGPEPLRIYLRVESSNSNNTQSIMLARGKPQALSTYLMLGPWKFDKHISLIGMRGAPGDKSDTNPSKVTQISIFCEKSDKVQRFLITSVEAEGEFKNLTADTFIPFIDEFGQFIHKDWQGKIHSLEELKKNQQIEEKQISENPARTSAEDSP